MIAIRGLLPAAFAVVMGVLIGAVQGGGTVATPLVAAGVLFMGLQALGLVHDALSSNLGGRVTGWLQDRLLDAARVSSSTARTRIWWRAAGCTPSCTRRRRAHIA